MTLIDKAFLRHTNSLGLILPDAPELRARLQGRHALRAKIGITAKFMVHFPQATTRTRRNASMSLCLQPPGEQMPSDQWMLWAEPTQVDLPEFGEFRGRGRADFLKQGP